MWRGTFGVWMLALLSMTLSAASMAQQSLTDSSGPLIVWLVRPVEHVQLPDQTLHQQTAGSYGTNASNYGTTAGSYGQTAGSYGRNAGDAGTTAGDYGQTAGSYGNSLSTIGEAGAANRRAADARADAAYQRERDPYRDQLRGEIGGQLPTLQPTYVAVPAEQLAARLAQVQGSSNVPDVVMGEPQLQPESRDVLRGVTATALGTPGLLPIEDAEPPVLAPAPEAVLMVAARHASAARAFLVALREPASEEHDFTWTDANREPVTLAVQAVQAVLLGGSIDAADKEFGSFAPTAARLRELAPQSAQALAGLRAETRPRVAELNDQLAVVRLFSVLASPRGFGTVHPLVVLRHGADGHWRVLSFTLNLAPELGAQALAILAPYTQPTKPTQLGQPQPVSAMTPRDSDVVQPPPQLGWQNAGGGTLLVVEWQLRTGSATAPDWTDSNLYFVPDDGSRLQTRAEARFANRAGVYRWRVWTVGAGGVLRLSDWHLLHVQGS